MLFVGVDVNTVIFIVFIVGVNGALNNDKCKKYIYIVSIYKSIYKKQGETKRFCCHLGKKSVKLDGCQH